MNSHNNTFNESEIRAILKMKEHVEALNGSIQRDELTSFLKDSRSADSQLSMEYLSNRLREFTLKDLREMSPRRRKAVFTGARMTLYEQDALESALNGKPQFVEAIPVHERNNRSLPQSPRQVTPRGKKRPSDAVTNDNPLNILSQIKVQPSYHPAPPICTVPPLTLHARSFFESPPHRVRGPARMELPMDVEEPDGQKTTTDFMLALLGHNKSPKSPPESKEADDVTLEEVLFPAASFKSAPSPPIKEKLKISCSGYSNSGLGASIASTFFGVKQAELVHRFYQNTVEDAMTLYESGEPIFSAMFKADKEIITGSPGGCLRRYNLRTGTCEIVKTIHKGIIRSVSPINDSNFVTGGADGSAHLLDFEFNILKSFSGHSGGVKCSTAIGAGQLFIGDGSGHLTRWQIESNKIITKIKAHILSIDAVCKLENKIFTASVDGLVKLFDETTMQCTSIYEATCPARCITPISLVRKTKKATVNADVVGVGCNDGRVRFYDARVPKMILCLQGHTDSVNCILFEDNPQELFTGGADTKVSRYDLRTSRTLYTFGGHKSIVSQLYYSPKSQYPKLFSAGCDGNIFAWDIEGSNMKNQKRESETTPGAVSATHEKKEISIMGVAKKFRRAIGYSNGKENCFRLSETNAVLLKDHLRKECNANERLDSSGFRKFCRTLGITDEGLGSRIFSYLDIEKQGLLSWDQFLNALYDLLRSELKCNIDKCKCPGFSPGDVEIGWKYTICSHCTHDRSNHENLYTIKCAATDCGCGGFVVERFFPHGVPLDAKCGRQGCGHTRAAHTGCIFGSCVCPSFIAPHGSKIEPATRCYRSDCGHEYTHHIRDFRYCASQNCRCAGYTPSTGNANRCSREGCGHTLNVHISAGLSCRVSGCQCPDVRINHLEGSDRCSRPECSHVKSAHVSCTQENCHCTGFFPSTSEWDNNTIRTLCMLCWHPRESHKLCHFDNGLCLCHGYVPSNEFDDDNSECLSCGHPRGIHSHVNGRISERKCESYPCACPRFVPPPSADGPFSDYVLCNRPNCKHARLQHRVCRGIDNPLRKLQMSSKKAGQLLSNDALPNPPRASTSRSMPPPTARRQSVGRRSISGGLYKSGKGIHCFCIGFVIPDGIEFLTGKTLCSREGCNHSWDLHDDVNSIHGKKVLKHGPGRIVGESKKLILRHLFQQFDLELRGYVTGHDLLMVQQTLQRKSSGLGGVAQIQLDVLSECLQRKERERKDKEKLSSEKVDISGENAKSKMKKKKEDRITYDEFIDMLSKSSLLFFACTGSILSQLDYLKSVPS